MVSKSDAKYLSSPVESCEVSLAGDVRKTWSKTPKGTLVAPATKASPQGEPQMLVPLGSIVSKLNCRLVWSRIKGLSLRHPKRGLIRTRVVNDCPQISREDALDLIKELEACQGDVAPSPEFFQAVLMDHLQGDACSVFQQYLTEGTKVQALRAMLSSEPFRGYVTQCQGLAVDNPIHDEQGWKVMKALPLPRRCRKRFFRSQWVVNFGAPLSSFFREVVRSKGYEVLEARHLGDQAWETLLWGAFSGRVAAVFSSGDTSDRSMCRRPFVRCGFGLSPP